MVFLQAQPPTSFIMMEMWKTAHNTPIISQRFIQNRVTNLIPSNKVLVTPLLPIGLPLLIDFENGVPYWNFEDTWGVSTSASHSPTHSITESPNGNYGNNPEIYATLNSFNLTGYTNASLSLWTKYALESEYDYMSLDIITIGTNLASLTASRRAGNKKPIH